MGDVVERQPGALPTMILYVLAVSPSEHVR